MSRRHHAPVGALAVFLLSQTAQAAWPVDNRCTAPGVQVATGATGDATINSGVFDVTGVELAEPYVNASDKSLTFTLKLSDLSATPAAPPNGIWKISWVATDSTGQQTKFFVTYDTTIDPRGSFGYGYTDETTAPPTDTNQCLPLLGDCPVTGSFDAASNSIVMKLKTTGPLAFGVPSGSTRADFSAAFGKGAVLHGVTGGTQLLVGAVGTGLIEDLDEAVGDDFTVRSNAYCRPNNPPVAGLVATPNHGSYPLEVVLSGASSSDPDGDAIATYHVDFGDGSATVDSNAATVVHTYTAAGTYTAQLRVTDERDFDGAAPATATITVVTPNPDPFSFTSKTGVDPGVLVASNEITLSGFSGTLPVKVANGSYSLNGGPFIATAGTVAAGDRLRVQQRTAYTANTAKTTTLTVGTVDGSFKTTTNANDANPDAFTIPKVTGVAVSTVVTSAAVTPVGYNFATTVAPVSTGTTISVAGGAFSNKAQALKPGQSLRVRHTSAATKNTDKKSVITVGSVQATFVSHTAP